MTWGLHVTLVSKWLDPADTEAFINQFMVLYAIHDAVVKPMPAGDNTPSLAESWTASKDGLTYEFVLRKGAKFHNGDPVTAEDVKFSFDRYRGAAAKLLKDRVKEIQIVDPGRVRFHLKEAWPDFMTFYGTSATGAAWIVPEIEDLYQRQARELDRKKREAMLYQIQQIMHDRVMHVPIYELAFPWGIGPRVEEACVNHIKGFSYSAPYEDLKLKSSR